MFRSTDYIATAFISLIITTMFEEPHISVLITLLIGHVAGFISGYRSGKADGKEEAEKWCVCKPPAKSED